MNQFTYDEAEGKVFLFAENHPTEFVAVFRDIDLIEEDQIPHRWMLKRNSHTVGVLWDATIMERQPFSKCLYYHGRLDSVGVCDFNEMRVCQLEATGEPCEILQEIEQEAINARVLPAPEDIIRQKQEEEGENGEFLK